MGSRREARRIRQVNTAVTLMRDIYWLNHSMQPII
jgi:hypothetical protein